MTVIASLAVLSLVSSSIRGPQQVAAVARCPPAACRLAWRPRTLGQPPVRRSLHPSSRLVAEEGLTSVLRTLVRKTASHTITGRGRDWRGVFQRLDSTGDGLLSVNEVASAVHEIAGSHALGDDGDLDSIVRKFDRNGNGKLCYVEFETMLKSLLRIPHDKVMLRSSPIAQPERYTTGSIWFSSLKNFSGSQVLRGILSPLLAMTLCSALVALIQLTTGVLPGGRAGKSLVQMHSLLGGALSLLLVFRTNSAYNRFWEARRIWESLLNRSRELARFIFLYSEDAGAPRVSLLVSLLCAFPRELRTHLVGEAKEEGADARRETVKGNEVGHPAPRVGSHARLAPPLPRSIAERIDASGNRPLYVCKWLASEMKKIPESLTFTSRERMLAMQSVNQLSSYVGACERLLQTPVPLNYARHTSRFLTLWCLTLPISLIDTMGLLVVPVTAFVTWSLFGIQEIGLFIEHCALDDGSIFMDTITELVALDVMEAVEEEPPLDYDIAELTDLNGRVVPESSNRDLQFAA